MNFKAIGIIVMMLFSVLAISDSVSAYKLGIEFDSVGTSHYYTIDIYDVNNNTNVYHEEKDLPVMNLTEYAIHLPDGDYKAIVNVKAWKMTGFFTYGWEKTGTTEEVSWSSLNKNCLSSGTFGDTCFNGGHLNLDIQQVSKYDRW
ncbi:MAG: hypothetical protein LBD03_02780 [Methanobrevibacter sp.]|jgi:hypothetical protein|nr:hypothetical protein [Candidatus Methanovirga procula]